MTVAIYRCVNCGAERTYGNAAPLAQEREYLPLIRCNGVMGTPNGHNGALSRHEYGLTLRGSSG